MLLLMLHESKGETLRGLQVMQILCSLLGKVIEVVPVVNGTRKNVDNRSRLDLHRPNINNKQLN